MTQGQSPPPPQPLGVQLGDPHLRLTPPTPGRAPRGRPPGKALNDVTQLRHCPRGAEGAPESPHPHRTGVLVFVSKGPPPPGATTAFQTPFQVAKCPGPVPPGGKSGAQAQHWGIPWSSKHSAGQETLEQRGARPADVPGVVPKPQGEPPGRRGPREPSTAPVTAVPATHHRPASGGGPPSDTVKEAPEMDWLDRRVPAVPRVLTVWGPPHSTLGTLGSPGSLSRGLCSPPSTGGLRLSSLARLPGPRLGSGPQDSTEALGLLTPARPRRGPFCIAPLHKGSAVQWEALLSLALPGTPCLSEREESVHGHMRVPMSPARLYLGAPPLASASVPQIPPPALLPAIIGQCQSGVPSLPAGEAGEHAGARGMFGEHHVSATVVTCPSRRGQWQALSGRRPDDRDSTFNVRLRLVCRQAPEKVRQQVST
ncbi:basic proline-rich protein-like [Acinonyx jubatus]|uniref:Basic proline-rich protein-like n=1 Tax=Acinonyx jubatus TaxID=32536 RepID=A0ABM3PQ22_ACIJB|nr:basic proline-rich protein-like [Acinonyx jubatus]